MQTTHRVYVLTLFFIPCREEHILRKIDQVVAEAKQKLAKGDKKGKLLDSATARVFLTHTDHTFFRATTAALFAMKRKKLYENEMDKIQNVKMTLETQVINLESAAQNAETYSAMAAGSNTMKKIRNDVGIDRVDDMMDSIKEEMEMAQEINQAIAAPVDPYMADDDELLEELNALEANDLEAELLAPPAPSIKLPSVPNTKLPAVAKKDDEDLKQLEAELAGL